MTISNQNELTFQLMVEASSNALLLINSQGQIVYLNCFAEKLLKYSKNELIGRDFKIIIPERFEDRYLKLLNDYFEKPVAAQIGRDKELFGVRNGNEEFPVEVDLNPIVTVDGILVLVSITDITDQKKANEQFRLVVESAPNAIILVSENGEISLVNKQTENLFGYARGELIGEKIEILLPTKLKESHPHLRNMFFKTPQSRSMGAGRDLYARRKDGSEIPIEIGLNPIEMSNGKQVLVSLIDISERKKIENAFHLHAKKIEEKNNELEQFTYIASHDLQEPLNTMISFIDLLGDDADNPLTEDQKQSFQFIQSASYRMKNLIKGLLDYSRLGKKSESRKISTRLLVESVCSDLDFLIKKSNAKVNFDELPTLEVYDIELRLLFQNLISNAIKFVAPGVEPEVAISAKKKKGIWTFSIKDNGIGIDPKYNEKIFIIFQRLHERDKYVGTGIGLAHCRKIVELHNGDIWVDSEVGKGSTFNFTINANI